LGGGQSVESTKAKKEKNFNDPLSGGLLSTTGGSKKFEGD
jgi:hypothetical protein